MENDQDIPITKNQTFEVNEFSEQNPDNFDDFPLLERLAHKNWKYRVSAYQDITDLFSTSEAKYSDIFYQLTSMEKYLVEANPNVLEKSLHMLKAYIKIGGTLDLSLTVKNSIEKGNFIIQHSCSWKAKTANKCFWTWLWMCSSRKKTMKPKDKNFMRLLLGI